MVRKRYESLLESGEVRNLLRAEIEKAGGQAAFARNSGLSRVNLNKILRGKRAVTKRIIKLLKLRVVYARD